MKPESRCWPESQARTNQAGRGWCGRPWSGPGFFLPRLVGKFVGHANDFDGRGWGPGHGQFRVGVGLGYGSVLGGHGAGFGGGVFGAPAGDTRLEAVMFGGDLVAGTHVEEGKIGVDELFVGPEFFGLEAFGNGGGKIAQAVMGHAEGELRIEVVGVLGEHELQLVHGAGEFTPAEGEHGGIVLFLQVHANTRQFKPREGETRMENGAIPGGRRATGGRALGPHLAEP